MIIGLIKNLMLMVLIVGSILPSLVESKSEQNYYPLTRLTDSGRLQFTIRSQVLPIPLNKLHSWTVKITKVDGDPVQPLEILIDGGMPRHQHGLPTQPAITRYQGNGEYLIEGLQFQMEGVWQLRFKCLDDNGWDQIIFKILVGADKIEQNSGWSDSELAVLKSLWIGSIPKLPSDPSNTIADNLQAAKFGHKIFFDPGFSRNQQVSCATCHQPEQHFTDGNKQSKGLSKVNRNAPSLIGVAYNRWYYWDGRRDSLWAQALTPFEAAQEMGITRVDVLKIIATQPSYHNAYQQLFGPLPEWITQNTSTVKAASPIGSDNEKFAWKTIPPRDKRAINIAFANIGKAIAAYERKLLPTPALFDRYIETLLNQGNEKAQSLLTPQQQTGMKLFIGGDTQCLTCHNGPLLTNQSFHNIGTGLNADQSQDMGRILGIQSVLLDEFNCQGRYSDIPQRQCDHLLYINRHEIGALMNGAFKVPSLRNVHNTAPYMHDGRFASLQEVLKHYQNPPDKTQRIHEISKLDLSTKDLENIAAFLKTLSVPIITSIEWLKAPVNQ
jgi:cytochrome c peroxidase